MTEKEYLSPVEIAELLGIAEGTVREWLRRGELKGIKVGRQWRIKRDILDKFLEGGGQGASNNK